MRHGMQLISRAAAVLRALEGPPGQASLGQIAKACDLPRATVQRIVDALEVEQLVTVDPQHGVRLGPALARMASAAFLDVATLAQPHLDHLARETGETAVLTVLRDRAAVYVAQALSDRPIRLIPTLGRAIPLHSTANGKALLAGLAEEEIRRLVGDPPATPTRNTLGSLAAVLAALAEVEHSGFAVDAEEQTEGICAIAVRVRDMTGIRYSLALLVPTPRFAGNLERFRRALAQCRSEIEAAAGRPRRLAASSG